MAENFTHLQLVIIFEVTALLLLFLLRRLRFDSASVLMFGTALCFTMIQFATTTPIEFENDIWGHLEYIAYIVSHKNLPVPTGFQLHQPPLYYWCAAVFQTIGDWLGASPLYSARVVSVWFYYGAMLYCALLLRVLISSPWLNRLCLALILFWPPAAHLSVKITNDIGQFFFASGFMYYLCLWTVHNHYKALIGAMLFAAGAMLTKGSALLLLLLLAGMLAYKFWCKELDIQQLRRRSVLIALLVLALGSTFNFARLAYWRNVENLDVKWLINREDDYVGTYEHMGNAPISYLYFDYQSFIEIPYARFGVWYPEARYVLNIFLKTILFSDASYPVGEVLASYLSFAFLVCLICGVVLWRSCARVRRIDPLHVLILGAIVAACAMVLSARIMIPVVWQGTARYIYIAVILMVALYGRSLSRLPFRGHQMLVITSLAAFISLFACSFAFTLLQMRWQAFGE